MKKKNKEDIMRYKAIVNELPWKMTLRKSKTDDNFETAKKPPLGVKPKALWQEERMQELARAIYEYVIEGYYDKLTAGLWCEELQTMLNKKY